MVRKSLRGCASGAAGFSEGAVAGGGDGTAEGVGDAAGEGATATAGAADGAVVPGPAPAGRVTEAGERALWACPGGTTSIGRGTALRVWNQNAPASAPATTTPKTSGIFERQSKRGASSSASSRAAMGMVGDSETLGGWDAHARACAARAASSTCLRAARGESSPGSGARSTPRAGPGWRAVTAPRPPRRGRRARSGSGRWPACGGLRSSSWMGGECSSSGSGEVSTAWSKSVALSQGTAPVRHS